MTGIIILNWNGWEDSIECLKSLYKLTDSEYFIVMVDNGSDNDSVQYMSSWLEKEQKSYYMVRENESFHTSIRHQDCILYCLSENYGFAKGNNLAVEFAKQFVPRYMILLNNDTEVEPDFLSELKNFITINPEYKALTPMIRYYDEKDLIWNCGGKLFFGLRKYYYVDDWVSNVKETGFFPISLITGCALFFPVEMVKEAPLLTEQYFFGEEDFEFSIRMRKKKEKMACVLTSQIYHKVGASRKKMNNLSRIYIHYLNRFVDVKHYFNPLKFFIWRQINYVYIFMMLRRMRFDFKRSCRLIALVEHNHKKVDGVSKALFLSSVSKDIYEISKL